MDELDIGPGGAAGENPGCPANSYCWRADVWGDSREEVIVNGGGIAQVYANSRPLAIPTLYNATLYTGM